MPPWSSLWLNLGSNYKNHRDMKEQSQDLRVRKFAENPTLALPSWSLCTLLLTSKVSFWGSGLRCFWEMFENVSLLQLQLKLGEAILMVSSILVLGDVPESEQTIGSKRYFAGQKLRHEAPTWAYSNKILTNFLWASPELFLCSC